jgi:threonine dehydratase
VFLHEVLEGAEELAPASSDTELLSRIKLSPEAQATLELKRSNRFLTPATSFRPRGAYREDW